MWSIRLLRSNLLHSPDHNNHHIQENKTITNRHLSRPRIPHLIESRIVNPSSVVIIINIINCFNYTSQNQFTLQSLNLLRFWVVLHKSNVVFQTLCQSITHSHFLTLKTFLHQFLVFLDKYRFQLQFWKRNIHQHLCQLLYLLLLNPSQSPRMLFSCLEYLAQSTRWSLQRFVLKISNSKTSLQRILKVLKNSRIFLNFLLRKQILIIVKNISIHRSDLRNPQIVVQQLLPRKFYIHPYIRVNYFWAATQISFSFSLPPFAEKQSNNFSSWLLLINLCLGWS